MIKTGDSNIPTPPKGASGVPATGKTIHVTVTSVRARPVVNAGNMQQEVGPVMGRTVTVNGRPAEMDADGSIRIYPMQPGEKIRGERPTELWFMGERIV